MKRGPTKRPRSYSTNSAPGGSISAATSLSASLSARGSTSPTIRVMSFDTTGSKVSVLNPQETSRFQTRSNSSGVSSNLSTLGNSPKPMERLPGIGSITSTVNTSKGSSSNTNGPTNGELLSANVGQGCTWPPPLQTLLTPPPSTPAVLNLGHRNSSTASSSSTHLPIQHASLQQQPLSVDATSRFVKAAPKYGRAVSFSDSMRSGSILSSGSNSNPNLSPRSESSNLSTSGESPRFSPRGLSPRFSPNLSTANYSTTTSAAFGSNKPVLKAPGSPTEHSLTATSPTAPKPFYWDDRCIDAYYRAIHPTLPILPPNRGELRARLSSCPDTDLHSTFWAILTTICKKQPGYFPHSQQQQHSINTSALLFPRLSSSTGQVLRLECLILLYLDSRSSLVLAAACSLANEMRLHEAVVSSASNMDDEARRLFLILLVLDRLHIAVHPYMRMNIPEEHVNLDKENDTRCFSGSQASFELVRLTLLMGRGLTDDSNWPLAAQLDDLGHSLETMWDTEPVLRAVYCFVRLVLAHKLGSQSSSQTSDALSLVFVVESPLVSVSPLMSHFAIVLNKTLCALVSKNAETKRDSSSEPDPRLVQLVDVIKHVILQQSPQLLPELQQGMSVVSDLLGQQRLEGLAAVAHAHANGQKLGE